MTITVVGNYGDKMSWTTASGSSYDTEGSVGTSTVAGDDLLTETEFKKYMDSLGVDADTASLIFFLANANRSEGDQQLDAREFATAVKLAKLLKIYEDGNEADFQTALIKMISEDEDLLNVLSQGGLVAGGLGNAALLSAEAQKLLAMIGSATKIIEDYGRKLDKVAG